MEKFKQVVIEVLHEIEMRFYNMFVYAGDDDFRKRMHDVGWTGKPDKE